MLFWLFKVWPDALRPDTLWPEELRTMQHFAVLSYGPYPEVKAVGPTLRWKASDQTTIRFGQPSRTAATATACAWVLCKATACKATACAWSLCHGSLLLDSTPPRRCICVPTRSKLPLRIASLGGARAGSSSFHRGGFSSMLHTLRACYALALDPDAYDVGSRCIASLHAELLAPMMMMMMMMMRRRRRLMTLLVVMMNPLQMTTEH